MDPNLPTTEMPEFELPETPVETPSAEAPTVMPEYVTRQDLETFAETLAAKLTPQATPTPPQADGPDIYAQIGELMYQDPAAAIRMAMEQSRKDTLAEVHQTYGSVALDNVTQQATRGMDPLEAEFVQMQVNEGLVHPQALANPKVIALLKPGAKEYAASRRATHTPKAEEGIGGAFRVTTQEQMAQKQIFERNFPGLKYEDAVKRANN